MEALRQFLVRYYLGVAVCASMLAGGLKSIGAIAVDLVDIAFTFVWNQLTRPPGDHKPLANLDWSTLSVLIPGLVFLILGLLLTTWLHRAGPSVSKDTEKSHA